ncbi:MAG: hypothetical protein KIS87_05605 [Phycisphaeraceae bacterium]|nr:hypothetical protein [Phycisphaeraceae bacterium]
MPWKHPSDPTYKAGRKRDRMTPEEHAAYRARIMARRNARREYRARRAAELDRRAREAGHGLDRRQTDDPEGRP